MDQTQSSTSHPQWPKLSHMATSSCTGSREVLSAGPDTGLTRATQNPGILPMLRDMCAVSRGLSGSLSAKRGLY